MNFDGSRTVKADRSKVWLGLNNPDVLKAAIPGCVEFTQIRDGEFESVVVQKVGPVKATFRGIITLSNVVPGESYTIGGEGRGGAAGFAEGAANVTLADSEGLTELTYQFEIRLGGRLAQLGGRIVDGLAKKMVDRFFERFAMQMEEPRPRNRPSRKLL